MKYNDIQEDFMPNALVFTLPFHAISKKVGKIEEQIKTGEKRS